MISYNAEHDLLVYRPTGTMDMAGVETYYHAVGQHRDGGCMKRLMDLDRLDRIDLGFSKMPAIAELARRTRARDVAYIRVALLATTPSAQGVANMLARLIGGEDYFIRVCKGLDEAADYLGVPGALLAPAE